MDILFLRILRKQRSKQYWLYMRVFYRNVPVLWDNEFMSFPDEQVPTVEGYFQGVYLKEGILTV